MRIMGNPVGRMAPKANWAQTNTNMADYIRNKPDLSGFALQEDLESVSEQVLTNIEALTVAKNDITVLQENGNAVNAEIATIKGNIPDTTLSISGKAADAKATGEALARLNPDSTLAQAGVPADAKATGEAIGKVRTDLDKIEDYLVETGMYQSQDYNGEWFFKKYASGEARCYGCFDFGSVKCTTTWGNMYESAGMYKQFPQGLFISAPTHIDMTLMGGSGAAFLTHDKADEMTKDQTGRFTLSRPTSMTLDNVKIGFEAVGRWRAD